MASFIDDFQALPGLTIKEKQVNLYKLFRQYQPQFQADGALLDHVTATLEPRGHLEAIFRIDFLIFFKRFEELYEGFRQSNDIVMSKLARQKWFFDAAYGSLEPEQFVKDILPTMSYVAKLKIVRRLPLSESEADRFFDALLEHYGLQLATVIITKCSPAKIEHLLRTELVKLTPNQLKAIFRKKCELVEVYLEERTKHEGGYSFMDWNPVYATIAREKPEIFAKLCSKYKFSARLGHRTTKNFVRRQKEAVLGDFSTYQRILNEKTLVRKLGPDLKDILVDPKDAEEIGNWMSLLQHCPRKQRFSMYKATYSALYSREFGADMEDVDEEVMDLMDDSVERERCAMAKIKSTEDDKYYKYVSPKVCLQEFIDKVGQMTTSKRAKFVEIVTECCARNEDLEVFLKVCELVAIRFKNDGRNTRYNFISTLGIYPKVIAKFGESHWKYIMDIMATIKAKEEWIHNEIIIRGHHLEFLIKNNQPIRDAITKYTEWADNITHYFNQFQSKHLRIIIMVLIEVGHLKNSGGDEESAALYDCLLLFLCKKYNEKYAKDEIDIFAQPRLLDSIEYLLNSDVSTVGYKEMEGLAYVLTRSKPPRDLTNLKKLYFDKFKIFGVPQSCFWFLKYEPETFAANFDKFLEYFPDIYGINLGRLWRSIKKHNFLNLDQRTVDYCLSKLQDDNFSDKKIICKILAMLATLTPHIQLVKSKIPMTFKVDYNDDDAKDAYMVQCQLVKTLHFLKAPAIVLPIALQFCKGDYLSSALSSVYSCFYNLPENQTIDFIKTIEGEKALSVKKHAVHLGCVIFDRKTVFQLLKTATVPTLLPTFKYYTQNPYEELWELVKANLCKVEKNDMQNFETLLKITTNVKCKSQCVEIIWKLAEKYENKTIKKLLIPKIDKNVIANLNPDFAYQIIQESVFKLKETNEFVANLLIHSTDPGKFDFIARILTDFKATLWETDEREARHKLSKFITNIYQIYMNLDGHVDDNFTTNFPQKFAEIFTITEAFVENLILEFMKFKERDVDQVAEYLIDRNNSLATRFGNYVTSLYTDVIMGHLLPLLYKTNAGKFQLCHSLFKAKNSSHDLMLIIKLLPNSEPKRVDNAKAFHVILNHLKGVEDGIVQLQLGLYLKKNTKKEKNYDMPIPCY